MTADLSLQGKYIRLEPLGHRHIDGLVAAAAADPSLYRWSPVPQGKNEAAAYVDTALAWRDAGTAVPFAIVRLPDETVIGSTRFWNIERWAWPADHPSHGRDVPDACEIGYSWLARSAVRTAVIAPALHPAHQMDAMADLSTPELPAQMRAWRHDAYLRLQYPV